MSSSLIRSLQVLEVCSESPQGISFSALREACGGLPAMALTRVLKPLMAQEYLAKSPETGHYIPGPVLLRIAGNLTGTLDIDAIVRKATLNLAEKTNESAAFFAWTEGWVTLKAKQEMPYSFSYLPEGSRERHSLVNVFFQAVCPYLDKATLTNLLNHPNNSGIPDPTARVKEELKATGALYSNEERRTNVSRIVAPVFAGPEQDIFGVIGITSPIGNMTEAEMAKLKDAVRKAAARLTKKLTTDSH